MLLPFVANAQTESVDMEDYLLDCYPGEGISGDFSKIITPAHYKQYLKKITGIKRVDDKTIIINSNSNAIKVVIDKGRISCRDPYKYARLDEKSSQFFNKEMRFWIADQIKEEDKEFTISIYDKSNKLLGTKKYDLMNNVNYSYFEAILYDPSDENYTKGVVIYPYITVFHYEEYGRTKKTIEKDEDVLSVKIDYNKPMNIDVIDYWGHKYNVMNFTVSSDKFTNVKCNGNVLSDIARQMIRNCSSASILRIEMVGRDGSACYSTPLKLTK